MELYEDVVKKLDTAECWDFLSSHTLGRLGYILVGDPQIVPINYVAIEEKIYFRTGEGSKLFGTTVHNNVAFEVDEWRGTEATSVVVHGTVTELDGSGADAVHDTIRPWIEYPKTHVLVIAPTEVTGRHFDMSEAHGA